MHPTCKIQWVNDKGQPTPDENESIGYVYCEAYTTKGVGLSGIFHHERSRDFPICAEHKKQIKGDAMRHWHFVPWPTEEDK